MRIYLQNLREILDTFVDHVKLLVRAAPDVIRTGMHLVQLHQMIAVIDGLLELPLLQVARRPDEERLLVVGVLAQLFAADSDQVVDIQCLPVHIWRSEEVLLLLFKIGHHLRLGLRQV